MKRLSVTELKAHALAVIRVIGETREPVLVTKHGKPVAELRAFGESKPQPGLLADTLVHEEDVVSPLGAGAWESAE